MKLCRCGRLATHYVTLPDGQKKLMCDGFPDCRPVTGLTHGRSRPVRYELVEPDGRINVSSESARFLAEHAERLWPGMRQDEDRMGKGWDIQVATD